MTATTVSAHHEIAPLTAQDRCDACGAQARVVYGLRTGKLFFCGHHSREFSDSLAGQATILRDETIPDGE
ncbi:MAG: hypothetical protein Q4B12_07235 [Bowdeniella nasicola]|nr:hypothetical protein [Bowdeniella nasicola]